MFKPKFYAFGDLDRRQVVADFKGGDLSTDGGVILIAQLDRQYRLSERLWPNGCTAWCKATKT
jgi:hypothetical protein